MTIVAGYIADIAEIIIWSIQCEELSIETTNVSEM
jgi:hypothetical protein